MSDKLGVSIIIPCYNAGTYILETIQSIQDQGVDPDLFEMIVVDDGSNDPETLESLKQLEGTPNLKIIHQENKGQSAARNVALRAAKFKYILPVDADDMLNSDPDFLAKHGSYIMQALETLEGDDRLAAVYSNNLNFASGREITSKPDIPYSEVRSISLTGFPAYLMYRRKDALAAGGYDQTLKSVEDWAFGISLLDTRLKNGQATGIIKFPEKYYLYRQHDHGNNVSARTVDYSSFFRDVVKKHSSIFQKHYPDVGLKAMPQTLVSNLENPLSSMKMRARFRLACSDPTWAASRIVPVTGNILKFWRDKTLSYLFARDVSGKEKAPEVQGPDQKLDTLG